MRPCSANALWSNSVSRDDPSASTEDHRSRRDDRQWQCVDASIGLTARARKTDRRRWSRPANQCVTHYRVRERFRAHTGRAMHGGPTRADPRFHMARAPRPCPATRSMATAWKLPPVRRQADRGLAQLPASGIARGRRTFFIRSTARRSRRRDATPARHGRAPDRGAALNTAAWNHTQKSAAVKKGARSCRMACAEPSGSPAAPLPNRAALAVSLRRHRRAGCVRCARHRYYVAASGAVIGRAAGRRRRLTMPIRPASCSPMLTADCLPLSSAATMAPVRAGDPHANCGATSLTGVVRRPRSRIPRATRAIIVLAPVRRSALTSYEVGAGCAKPLRRARCQRRCRVRFRRGGGHCGDLYALLVRRRLATSRRKRVSEAGSSFDTFLRPAFSYRRDGSRSGRFTELGLAEITVQTPGEKIG